MRGFRTPDYLRRPTPPGTVTPYDPYDNDQFAAAVAEHRDGGVSLREVAYRPTGALAETFPRHSINGSAYSGVSGTLVLTAIPLPKGAVVSSITFLNGATAANTPTDYWFSLYDSSRALLARTADQLTAAWGTNTTKTLPIATTAAGSATSFTTTYAGLHYLGFVMTATALPNLMAGAITGNTNFQSLPPILSGTSNTGLTTQSAYPFTANALTPMATLLYGYVS
jgi:hypothetical protein